MNNVRKIWENCNIQEKFPRLPVRFDEPMALHTTFRVGGSADLYAEPASAEELVALLSWCTAEHLPVCITGGGSNLVIADRGFRGACVSLAAFRTVSVNDEHTLVSVGAGFPVDELVSWCAERSLSGIEQFAGLPGTVGGAVYMNARCYDRSVSDVFFSAEALYFRDGRYTIATEDWCEESWGYKKSPFQAAASGDTEAPVVLSAVFRVVPGDPADIRETMDRCVRDREQKGHFRFPSAGSMFKNNRAFGKSSGQIIDEAGLRGFAVGDAQVAPWHGNLVINRGNARAEDIRILVDEVRETVLRKTGFLLETEVVFAGEW